MHSSYLKSAVGHGFVEIVDIVSHNVNSRIYAMVSLGTVTASSSAASVKVVFLTYLMWGHHFIMPRKSFFDVHLFVVDYHPEITIHTTTIKK